MGDAFLAQDYLRLAARLAAYQANLMMIAVERVRGEPRAPVPNSPQHGILAQVVKPICRVNEEEYFQRSCRFGGGWSGGRLGLLVAFHFTLVTVLAFTVLFVVVLIVVVLVLNVTLLVAAAVHPFLCIEQEARHGRVRAGPIPGTVSRVLRGLGCGRGCDVQWRMRRCRAAERWDRSPHCYSIAWPWRGRVRRCNHRCACLLRPPLRQGVLGGTLFCREKEDIVINLPVAKLHLVSVGRTVAHRVDCPFYAGFQAVAEVYVAVGRLNVIPNHLQGAFFYQPFCTGPYPERVYPGLLIQRSQTSCLQGAVRGKRHNLFARNSTQRAISSLRPSECSL